MKENNWEEEFDKLRPHTKNCHIWDFLDNPKRGVCTCGKFKIMELIKSLLERHTKEARLKTIEEIRGWAERTADNPGIVVKGRIMYLSNLLFFLKTLSE